MDLLFLQGLPRGCIGLPGGVTDSVSRSPAGAAQEELHGELEQAEGQSPWSVAVPRGPASERPDRLGGMVRVNW